MTPYAFDMYLDQFLVAKRAAGKAPRSLEWYKSQITVYLDWLRDQAAADSWDHAETIELYLAGQRDPKRKLADNTYAARYRSLKIWFNWLTRRRKLWPESPMAEIEKPHVPRVVVAHVTLAEFRRLYDAVSGTSWLDYRDRCALSLLFWSGLRLSEVVGLNLGDVDTVGRLITVHGGKGGKDRIVPCAPELGPQLLAYLMARPPWSDRALFVSNDGAGGVRGVLTANGLRQMVRRRCTKANVRYMHPHSFRHGFAMAFLNAGMQMSAISSALGHSSEQVTASIYAHWLTEGLSAEYDQTRRRLVERMAGV